MTFRIVGRTLVADLGFLSAHSLDVAPPSGETFTRLLIAHPGAAAAVLYADGDVVLVRQYRAAIDDWLIEIPAGKLDVGEDPLEAARREAGEETGWRPEHLTLLTSLHTGPGFTDEVIHVYLGTDLVASPAAPDGPEESTAEVMTVPLTEAIDLIDQGVITDSKTVSGLLLAREALK